MHISRRAFTAGALSAAVSVRFASPALAQGSPAIDAAIAAIRAHGEEHLRHFGLPGLTLGLTTPAGLSTVLDFGFANRDNRAPISPDTLFQIGSISKSMTSAVVHQLAAEGRLKLSDRVSALLPVVHLPSGNTITVQHLLDHSAGLPDDAPLFADGGLWTSYAPGQHWHYSNTGYDMLGKIAEHAGGKPLGRLLAERIFAPLGMRRSKGAIIAADRLLYAQGYEPADLTIPFAIGAPLAPAAWVDVTFGAGSVASTADDMLIWARALVDGALLDPAMQQVRLDSIQSLGPDFPTAEGKYWYGYGIDRRVTYDGHGGQINGYNSAVARDPATDTTIVVLTTLTLAPDGTSVANALLYSVINGITDTDTDVEVPRQTGEEGP